jgi:hypothetical protein
MAINTARAVQIRLDMSTTASDITSEFVQYINAEQNFTSKRAQYLRQ